MKNTLFKIASLILITCLCLATASCGRNQPPISTPEPEMQKIKIPDILGLDESTAKTLLAGKGLIPKCEYGWNSEYPEGQVAIVNPNVGSMVAEDDVVTLTISKGPAYYELKDAVGYMKNVYNVEAFSWDDNTKGFYNVYVKEGYLCIDMYICCVSDYKISFYGNFGSASLTETFNKTVPMIVNYESKNVDNTGKATFFGIQVQLSDLGEKRPTSIYIEFDFVVGGSRERFEAGFDLSW